MYLNIQFQRGHGSVQGFQAACEPRDTMGVLKLNYYHLGKGVRYGARLTFETHYGPTWIVQLADYSPRHHDRRDGRAGTVTRILYNLHIYRRTHSRSVMTIGRAELMEHGHRSHYCWGRRTLQPEYAVTQR